MEWMVALGLIVLPLIVLLASVQVWLDRKAVAEALANEAARAVAIAVDHSTAVQAVDLLESRQEARLGVPASACPSDGGCLHVRMSGNAETGGEVRSEVSVFMPGIIIPFIGEISGTWWTTGHTEMIDPYRVLP